MSREAVHATDVQERVVVINDPATGVQGAIAIHSTALGPAAGGCRLWNYGSHTAMVDDAVRLARGMSFKNAMAGLPLGGGKAVLQRPSGTFDRGQLFRVFADAVEELGGEYVTAADVGTDEADMQLVRERTRHVAGFESVSGKAGGDPSPWTALGVFEAMKAAARDCMQSDLAGLTVAVQGVGSVGSGLCQLLADAGTRLVICDVDGVRAKVLAAGFGAEVVGVDEIYSADADIFAPCALGGTLNRKTIPRLKVGLVCGGANNQLATDEDGHLLVERQIGYAPDYVVNAGGIINVAAEYLGEDAREVRTRVLAIPARLTDILRRARDEGRPANLVADDVARAIIAGGRARAVGPRRR